MYLKQLVISSLILFSGLQLNAQNNADAAGVQPSGDAISIYLGPYLPKNFGNVDEVLKAVGIRYSLASGANKYYELGLTSTRTAGNKYQDTSLSLRGDIPLADFTAFGLGGINLHRLRTPGSQDYTYYGGGHVGGGILGQISGTSFFRLEMRLNMHPGTNLFFGVGLEFHFGGSSGGGGAE